MDSPHEPAEDRPATATDAGSPPGLAAAGGADLDETGFKAANRARFETDLEFVQCLANPFYLQSESPRHDLLRSFRSNRTQALILPPSPLPPQPSHSSPS